MRFYCARLNLTADVGAGALARAGSSVARGSAAESEPRLLGWSSSTWCERPDWRWAPPIVTVPMQEGAVDAPRLHTKASVSVKQEVAVRRPSESTRGVDNLSCQHSASWQKRGRATVTARCRNAGQVTDGLTLGRSGLLTASGGGSGDD